MKIRQTALMNQRLQITLVQESGTPYAVVMVKPMEMIALLKMQVSLNGLKVSAAN